MEIQVNDFSTDEILIGISICNCVYEDGREVKELAFGFLFFDIVIPLSK